MEAKDAVPLLEAERWNDIESSPREQSPKDHDYEDDSAEYGRHPQLHADRLASSASRGLARCLFMPRAVLLGLGIALALLLSAGLGAGTTHVVTKYKASASSCDANASGMIWNFDPDKLAVIIEKRNLATLQPVLLTFLARTPPEWAFQIYHGTENAIPLNTSRLLAPYIASGKLKLIHLGEDERKIYDGTSLSRFLTLPAFWERLAPAKHILFFQADTILCGNSDKSINDFLGFDVYETGYDWVGAPWWFWGYPHKPYGGNGGFCIRRREAMLNVTRQFGHEWKDDNEDIWFADKLEKTSNQFPTTQKALEFSFETPPNDALELDWVYKPYGVHIGNGGSWPLCQSDRPNKDRYVNKLLAFCPEAKTVIPNSCIPGARQGSHR